MGILFLLTKRQKHRAWAFNREVDLYILQLLGSTWKPKTRLSAFEKFKACGEKTRAELTQRIQEIGVVSLDGKRRPTMNWMGSTLTLEDTAERIHHTLTGAAITKGMPQMGQRLHEYGLLSADYLPEPQEGYK